MNGQRAKLPTGYGVVPIVGRKVGRKVQIRFESVREQTNQISGGYEVLSSDKKFLHTTAIVIYQGPHKQVQMQRESFF